jgi:hypothetical protein
MTEAQHIAKRIEAAAHLLQGLSKYLHTEVPQDALLPRWGRRRSLVYRGSAFSYVTRDFGDLMVHVQGPPRQPTAAELRTDRELEETAAEDEAFLAGEQEESAALPCSVAAAGLPAGRPVLALPPKQGQVGLPGVES